VLLERVASWLERLATRIPEDSELSVYAFALLALYVVVTAYAVDRVLELLRKLYYYLYRWYACRTGT
jgi:hypothetical protein